MLAYFRNIYESSFEEMAEAPGKQRIKKHATLKENFFYFRRKRECFIIKAPHKYPKL